LGEHDENITFEQMAADGQELAAELRELTLAVYRRGAEIAEKAGVILADTKLEFGRDANGRIVLGDEVLTPDSSRYWPADGYQAGHVQPAFDKQYVRDWLTSPASGWDRKSDTPPPPLPADVIAATRAKYVEAYERVTGKRF
jgi:phosphoribosylaminoimidazole-succinocarboxamide synthase